MPASMAQIPSQLRSVCGTVFWFAPEALSQGGHNGDYAKQYEVDAYGVGQDTGPDYDHDTEEDADDASE